MPLPLSRITAAGNGSRRTHSLAMPGAMATMAAMFTPHLYDHRFDIDDLIQALCDNTHSGDWCLDTRTGQLTPLPPSPPTPAPSTIDGKQRLYHLTPLHVHILPTFLQHPGIHKLAPGTAQAVATLVDQTTHLTDIIQHFNTPAGAFLRERFKEIAMEWLDEHNLIPPSMRHINKKDSVFSSTRTPRRVTIHES